MCRAACGVGHARAPRSRRGRARTGHPRHPRRCAYSQYAIAQTPALHVKCAHPSPPFVQTSQRAGSAPLQSLATEHSPASTGGGGLASAEPEPPSRTGHAMVLACPIVPFSQKQPPHASLLHVHDVPFAWLTPLSTHGVGPASFAGGGGAASATHASRVLVAWPLLQVQVLQPSLQVHDVPSAWDTPLSMHGAGPVPASLGGGRGMACEKQSVTLGIEGSLRQQSAGSTAGTCHPLGQALHDGGEGSGHAGAGLQVQLLEPVVVCAGQLQTGSEQSGFATV